MLPVANMATARNICPLVSPMLEKVEKNQPSTKTTVKKGHELFHSAFLVLTFLPARQSFEFGYRISLSAFDVHERSQLSIFDLFKFVQIFSSLSLLFWGDLWVTWIRRGCTFDSWASSFLSGLFPPHMTYCGASVGMKGLHEKLVPCL